VGSKMKILLVQDVEKLGRAGELKEVSGGYGRNYLLPQGFAVLATKGQIKQAEERIAANRKREQAARTDAEAVAARFNGQTIRFVVNAGEDGRLYGSVTSGDIAERIAAIAGSEIDRRRVQLDDTIKRIGTYPVTVRLMSGVEPSVTVVVETEGGNAPVAAPATEATETAELPDLDEAA
jgi:large subunit ribosomal protein L9